MLPSFQTFFITFLFIQFFELRAETRKFTIVQPLDHFNNSTTAQFNQTYYVIDDYWQNKNGPLLILMGYASPFDPVLLGVGTHHELAKKYNGLLLGIEARGFGDSLNSEMLKKEYLSYLTFRQILKDFPAIQNKVINDYGVANDAAKIVFGYSFGSFFASFYHLVYPELTNGLFASSGPLLVDYDAYMYFSNVGWKIGDPNAGGSSECLAAVNKAFNDVDAKLSNAKTMWSEVANDFKFCQPCCICANLCFWN